MAVRSRLFALVAVLLLTLSATGLALAQTDGPDPDSPIKLPTAEATEEESPQAESTPLDDNEDEPTDEATPVASTSLVDLAAMTLDSSSIPEDFLLLGEGYTSIEALAESLVGQIDREALLATGIEGYYESYYVNEAGNTLRTYVISYATTEGVQGGFDLLEDEEILVPNGALVDLPGLPGVGEEPAEITSGTIENGDGTRTGTYDITFRIDRYHVGAAMETYDGSEPLTEIVEDLAADLAARVSDVVAGADIEGVVYGLPDELIRLDIPAGFEGYQTVDETFLISEPSALPAGYLSGYYRGASYSTSVMTVLPYVTVGVNQFASADEAQAALSNPDSMMPAYPDLTERTDIQIEGADAVAAFSFSSPNGEGAPDSVRIFAQVDDQLISIDVQGMESIDEAESAAVNLAELQLRCIVNGVCNVPGSIDPRSEA